MLALAAVTLAAYADALLTDGSGYPLAEALNQACLAMSVIGATLLLTRQLACCPRAPGRTASLVVLLGMAAGLLPFTAVLIGPSLLGSGRVPAPWVAACLVTFPVIYAYAVQRHRLLGLPSLWDRRRARVVGVAILTGGYLLILLLLLPRLQGRTPAGLLLLLVAVFALGLSALPLARLAAFTVDRALFHDAYSHHRALRQLVDTVADAGDIRVATAHALGDVRRWLDLSWLALLDHQDHGWRVLAQDLAYGGAEPPGLATALAAGETVNPGGGARHLGMPGTFPVDVHVGEEVVLLAGPKANGEALRRADRDVLVALATMLGAPLARARLLADAQERVAELEHHKAALQALGQRLMMAQDTERQRLAVELHDGPLQRLHYLLRLFDGGTPTPACRAVAAQVAIELRSTALTLRPPALDDELGLPGALAALARRTEPTAGCPIAVETKGYARDRLAPVAERALYRIAREALNNGVRHSGASAITITLHLNGHGATLEIRDDGMGFDPKEGTCGHAADDRQRLGLLEMREAAEACGGMLTVSSAPGQGTALRATLPMRVAKENSA